MSYTWFTWPPSQLDNSILLQRITDLLPNLIPTIQAATLPFITKSTEKMYVLCRGVDIWFFPLGSIPLTHCCYNIVDTPFTKTVLDFSRKISKEKNDILLDLQTSDKNTHQYIFSKIKMYDFFHILAFPYIKKEHLPICYTQWCKVY